MDQFNHARSYSNHQNELLDQYKTAKETVDCFPQQSYHKHHNYSFTTNQHYSDSSINREKGFKMLQDVRKQLAQIESSKTHQKKTKTQSDIYLSPYSGNGIGSRFKEYNNLSSNHKERWNDIELRSPKNNIFERQRFHNNQQDHQHRIGMPFQYPKNDHLNFQNHKKVEIKLDIQPKKYEPLPSKKSVTPQAKSNFMHDFKFYRQSFAQTPGKPSEQFKLKLRQPQYFLNNNNKYEEIIRKKCEIEDIIENQYNCNDQYRLKGDHYQSSHLKCLLKHKNKNVRAKPISPKSKPAYSYNQQYFSKGDKKSTKPINITDFPKKTQKSLSKKKQANLTFSSNNKSQSKQHKKIIQQFQTLPIAPSKQTIKHRYQSNSKSKNNQNSCQKQINNRSKDARVNYPPSSPYYRKKIQSKEKRLSTEKINYNSNFAAKEVVQLKSQIKDLQSKINKQFQQTLKAKKHINKSGQYTHFMNNFWDQIQNSSQSRQLNKQSQESIKRHVKHTTNSPNKVGSHKMHEQPFQHRFSQISPIHSRNSSPSKRKIKQQLSKHFLVNHYLKDEDIDKVYVQIVQSNLPEQQWIIIALNEVYRKQHQKIKPSF